MKYYIYINLGSVYPTTGCFSTLWQGTQFFILPPPTVTQRLPPNHLRRLAPPPPLQRGRASVASELHVGASIMSLARSS